MLTLNTDSAASSAGDAGRRPDSPGLCARGRPREKAGLRVDWEAVDCLTDAHHRTTSGTPSALHRAAHQPALTRVTQRATIRALPSKFIGALLLGKGANRRRHFTPPPLDPSPARRTACAERQRGGRCVVRVPHFRRLRRSVCPPTKPECASAALPACVLTHARSAGRQIPVESLEK